VTIAVALLGLVLVVLGFVLHSHWLWILGVAALVLAAILFLLVWAGNRGANANRRRYY
jgi:hypothetical protein